MRPQGFARSFAGAASPSAGEGLSNREIGQKLFVSPRTVSTHLYRIYPKLGISARGELASALSSQGSGPQR